MGTEGRRMGKVRVEGWGSSGVCPQTRAGQLSSHLENGSQGDFSIRGRAEPWKPKRIRLQPGLWPLEAARVNYNRGQGQERAGVAQGTCWPQSLPHPGAPVLLAGLGSARRAPVRHRLPSRAKWEGADCKVSAAESDLGVRTGRLCRPEWPSPSSSRCCKVNSCPTPPFLCFSRCTGPARERPSLSRPQARSDRRAPRGNGPTLTLAAAMLHPGAGGCGTRSHCGLAAHFPSRRRARPACLPTPSRPRRSCGRRQPIGWAGPGRRGACDAAGLCPAPRAVQGPWAADWTRARDRGWAVQRRRPLRREPAGIWGASLSPRGSWPLRGLQLIPGATPGPWRLTAWGSWQLRYVTCLASFSLLVPFQRGSTLHCLTMDPKSLTSWREDSKVMELWVCVLQNIYLWGCFVSVLHIRTAEIKRSTPPPKKAWLTKINKSNFNGKIKCLTSRDLIALYQNFISLSLLSKFIIKAIVGQGKGL